MILNSYYNTKVNGRVKVSKHKTLQTCHDTHQLMTTKQHSLQMHCACHTSGSSVMCNLACEVIGVLGDLRVRFMPVTHKESEKTKDQTPHSNHNSDEIADMAKPNHYTYFEYISEKYMAENSYQPCTVETIDGIYEVRHGSCKYQATPQNIKPDPSKKVNPYNTYAGSYRCIF